MNKVKIGIFIFMGIIIHNVNAQDFTNHVSFAKFETYAKSINLEGYTFIFAEQKGKLETKSVSYSAMLGTKKGSLIIKMMSQDEFANGPDKLADVNTGVYENENHKMVFWSLTKAKQSFLWIEMPYIKATFILGMQPVTNQESIEELMKKIGCLTYFKQ